LLRQKISRFRFFFLSRPSNDFVISNAKTLFLVSFRVPFFFCYLPVSALERISARNRFSRKSSYNSYYLVAIFSRFRFQRGERKLSHLSGPKQEEGTKREKGNAERTQIITVASRLRFSIAGKLRARYSRQF